VISYNCIKEAMIHSEINFNRLLPVQLIVLAIVYSIA